MKLPLLSAAFVACALLSGQASALMIYGGNACDPLGGTADLDYWRLDNGFITHGANTVSATSRAGAAPPSQGQWHGRYRARPSVPV